MAIEFRGVCAGPLKDMTAAAPAGAIIGVIGGKNSGVTELLKLAGGLIQPQQGEIKAGSQRRHLGLDDTLNLAPADVIALDQALATDRKSVV